MSDDWKYAICSFPGVIHISDKPLTLYSIITSFDIYSIFETIMENGEFAPLEQMLHLP